MNFEFPFKELPAVMRGPRIERRRVLVGGSAFWGTLVESGAGAGRLRLDDGRLLDAESANCLPPVDPGKIIAVHIAFSSRSMETRNKARPTDTPTYFTKPPSALNGHRGQILKPADCRYLNYEGEYAVVIGRTCRNVTPDEAWDFIEGFCPALDMGLQDFRDTDQGSMLRVKGADTLLPIGPGIVRGVNLFEQTLRTYVDGLVVQEAHIGEETIWGPHYVIADLARHITLVPGDVILMGTPCHSRSVDAGQLVECEITGIGRIAGTVVAIDAPRAAALGVGHAPTDSAEVRRVALGFDERVPDRFKANLRLAKERQVMTRKVCIVGAGAIGGFIGTRLAVAGRAEVSALARGATLQALRQHGWRADMASGRLQTAARASDNAAELGVQDLVIIAVKGPALTQVARGIGPLLGPETIVLPAMNGVPWWFCEGVPGFAGETLHSVDPGATIAAAIPFEQVLGCVVHISAAMPEPGLVQHKVGQGLIVGEPRGGRSQRAQAVVDLLADAGFDVTHADQVRWDIWYKLWGNLTMNPVSAITGATVDAVLADPLVRDFCSAAMQEAAAIGALIGCRIDQSPEDRHAVTARLGAFKTSMLQDVEAGRPIELDAIVTAVHEIGVRLDQPMPNIKLLLGLTRLFGRVRGLYPQV